MLPHNPHARIELSAAACAMPEEATCWLEEQGLASEHHHLTAEGGSFELMAALRLKHATEEERAYGGSYALLEGVHRVRGSPAAHAGAPHVCTRTRAPHCARCERALPRTRSVARARATLSPSVPIAQPSPARRRTGL